MKKSYHSIVVPMVDAMTALRSCALCSDADTVSYVAVLTAMSFFRRFLVGRPAYPAAHRRAGCRFWPDILQGPRPDPAQASASCYASARSRGNVTGIL